MTLDETIQKLIQLKLHTLAQSLREIDLRQARPPAQLFQPVSGQFPPLLHLRHRLRDLHPHPHRLSIHRAAPSMLRDVSKLLN